MGRPLGPSTRFLSLEDRGTDGDKRFRVRVLVDGRRHSRGFATRGAAERWIESFRRDVAVQAGATVGDLVQRWLDDRERQRLPVQRYHGRWVRAILADVLDSPAQAATGAAMADGFRRWADQSSVSGATNRLGLSCLKMFGAWLVDERVVGDNPAAAIKPRGSARKGKPQIETKRELLAFRDELWRCARGDDPGRGYLACLLGLYLGLRSGEVRALEARHVDLDGLLRVPGTKTDNAPRFVQVPPELQELRDLLEDAAAHATGPLVPLGEQALIKRVRAAADAARVSNAEELVYHSLRGMAATAAKDGGATTAAIALALGHGGQAVTERHYVSARAKGRAAARERLTVLRGGK